MRSLLLALAALVLAPAPAAQTDWTGRWESCWVDGCTIMDLVQTADRVRGTYSLYDGVIEGTVDGRTLTGTWAEPDDGGTIVFTLAPDGQTFFGRDGVGDWWNGGRLPGDGGDVAEAQTGDPRQALLSFLTGMNAVREHGLEHFATAMPALTFARDPEPPPPWDRVERANAFFQVLDQTVVRIYDVPHTDLVGPDTSLVAEQLGTGASVRLEFLADDEGRWGIVVPSRPALDSTLAVLLRARDDEATLRALLATKGLIGTVPDRHHALDSPRATMRAFMDGFSEGDEGRERIEAALDLSRVDPAVRAQEAPLLADFLRQVLLRAGTLVWQQIPDDPASDAPYVHFVHPRGRIVVAPGEAEDGRRVWRFTPETLAGLRGLYEAIDDLPVDEALVAAVPEAEERSAFFRLRDRVADVSPALVRRAGLAETWQWLALAILLMLAPLVALAAGRLAAGPAVDASDVGPSNRARTRWPVRLVVLGGAVLWAVSHLGLPQVLFSPLRAVGLVVLIAGGVGAVFVAVDAVSRRLVGREWTDGAVVVDDILVSLAAGVAKIVAVVTGILLVSDALALPYQSVLAGIGIGGLAFAIAAQDTIANFFGSAVIMADRPFRKGDLVTVGERQGIVQHVGLRSTQLRTRDDELVVIPNAHLAKETVDNRGQQSGRRVDFTLGVVYGTPPDRLDAFARRVAEVADRHAGDGPPARVGVWAFGPSSVDLKVVCFVPAASLADEQAARHRLLLDLLALADEMGVAFAFPTQTVLVEALPHGGDGHVAAPSPPAS